MNPKVLIFITLVVGLVSFANGQIGALTLVGLSSGTAALTAGTAALTSGTTVAFLTPAGAVAVAIGLVGAAIVKKAIAANVAGFYTQDFRNIGRPQESYGAPVESYAAPSSGYGAPRARASRPHPRSKRATAEETAENLDQIDSYFYTIANADLDDCGKRYVCEIETLSPELRSEEEELVAGLFGENNVIDPATFKAEYDLAAYLGSSTRSKIACARRYHKCPMDRKTIGQAMEKQKAAALAAQAQPE